MTEIVQLIPARLKNAAVGGHVAGADMVYDDTIGKTQEEINSDVSSNKADKTSTVSNVTYDSSSRKIQKTINGITTDVVTLPEAQVNSDWNASSGVAQILNKPTIPTAVAVKGDAEATYRTGNVNITPTNIGLGSVVNTGDSATPVSGGTTKFTTGGAYTELAKKVDKVSGKGLSTNDYTTDEKNKLAGIAAGAEVNVQSDWNATSGDAQILNKPTIPAAANNGTYTVKTLVGSTTTNVSDFTANQSSADDVTFVQGSNVTITPDATNRKITISSTDTNTWRPVSDSVSSTDSSTAASSKAVKTAYDLAASKTSNTGTVTSVAVKMNGSVKGTVTTNGTIDLGTVITSHQDISGKADKSTTLSGYGITNAYTKTEIDKKIGNIETLLAKI